MTGTLIRCVRRTPSRYRCDCPLRWSPQYGWVHAPIVASETWDDYPHIDRELHIATPPDWVPPITPERQRLASQGRVVKKRVPR